MCVVSVESHGDFLEHLVAELLLEHGAVLLGVRLLAGGAAHWTRVAHEYRTGDLVVGVLERVRRVDGLGLAVGLAERAELDAAAERSLYGRMSDDVAHVDLLAALGKGRGHAG